MVLMGLNWIYSATHHAYCYYYYQTHHKKKSYETKPPINSHFMNSMSAINMCHIAYAVNANGFDCSTLNNRGHLRAFITFLIHSSLSIIIIVSVEAIKSISFVFDFSSCLFSSPYIFLSSSLSLCFPCSFLRPPSFIVPPKLLSPKAKIIQKFTLLLLSIQWTLDKISFRCPSTRI